MIHLNLPKNICQALLFLGFALLLGACEREEDPAGLTPVVAQIDKLTLQAGDVLEIAGRNFGSSPEALTVNFNGRIAELLEVRDNRLLVTVPAGAGSGQLRVIRNERSSNAYPYAYRFRLGISVEIAIPNLSSGGEIQFGEDGNLYYLETASENFPLYRFDGNNFIQTGRSAPGSNFRSFFVDRQGNFYYRINNQVIKNNDTSSPIVLPLADFASGKFFVDGSTLYYYSFDDNGGAISTVNINDPADSPVFFAPAPNFSSSLDFILKNDDSVFILEEGFSSDPSIIYESGFGKVLRQTFAFSDFSGPKRLIFSPNINLLCVSSGNNLIAYDTFGNITYEIAPSADWSGSSVEGVALGEDGSLYVLLLKFSPTFEYTIRRVTLE